MDESLGYILGVLIWAVIWGCITKKINENKGYVGGFAWGFWLGFIGLIVVLCKRENVSYNQNASHSNYNTSPARMENEWRCNRCNTMNAESLTSCKYCGKPKNTIPLPKEKSNISDADELAKFKKLFDDGVITQEEYDKKKKQILGL